MQSSQISYAENRADGITHVTVNANIRNATELDELAEGLRGPLKGSDGPDPEEPVEPPIELPPDPPTTRQPYFDVGDGQGRAGEVVEIPVIGGCRFRVNGFHIGGGCGKLDEPRSGYGLFEAVGVKLGPFLQSYLDVNHMGSTYWAIFQMLKHEPSRALPEEWWEYAMATFSISEERGPLPPIQIPVETLLFTLRIKILEGTPPGVYELTCEDEHYYTHARQRRRDFLYTTDRDSPLASGGVTDVDCQGGKLTVIA